MILRNRNLPDDLAAHQLIRHADKKCRFVVMASDAGPVQSFLHNPAMSQLFLWSNDV
jgi:hypothetical protein